MPALRKKGWLSRSHKLQLEIDRSVIKHEIPREVASLGVAELTETRRCVEIEWVAWLMPDAQKCTFKIVCCGTWHYGVLHKWVLCDRWKDDCIWRSANLKKKKFNLFCLTQHSGWSEILCQVYIYHDCFSRCKRSEFIGDKNNKTQIVIKCGTLRFSRTSVRILPYHKLHDWSGFCANSLLNFV